MARRGPDSAPAEEPQIETEVTQDEAAKTIPGTSSKLRAKVKPDYWPGSKESVKAKAEEVEAGSEDDPLMASTKSGRRPEPEHWAGSAESTKAVAERAKKYEKESK